MQKQVQNEMSLAPNLHDDFFQAALNIQAA